MYLVTKVHYIKENFGTISTRTFREGTRGALKIVYWANIADVKVLVLTNLGQEEDIKRAREYGIDGYFIKTNVSIQDLVSKIKSFLG